MDAFGRMGDAAAIPPAMLGILNQYGSQDQVLRNIAELGNNMRPNVQHAILECIKLVESCRSFGSAQARGEETKERLKSLLRGIVPAGSSYESKEALFLANPIIKSIVYHIA